MFKGIVLLAALATGVAPMATVQRSSTDNAFVMKTAQLNNYEIQAAQERHGRAISPGRHQLRESGR